MTYVPKEETVVEFTVSRSRFITYLKAADTIEQAVLFRDEIRKRYTDATHVCYAAVTPTGQKASDDGEPKGTAQLPMLQALKANNLSAVAVTVRYFGGIKLGTGGLNAAYAKGVADAIAAATLLQKCLSISFAATVAFSYYGALKSALSAVRCPLVILEERFLQDATAVVAVPVEHCDAVQKAIIQATLGTATVTQNTQYYQIYPLEA